MFMQPVPTPPVAVPPVMILQQVPLYQPQLEMHPVAMASVLPVMMPLNNMMTIPRRLMQ
jgi:hypothetical protein